MTDGSGDGSPDPRPPKRRAVVTAFMNMKGGVGKSTMAANAGWFAAYYRNLRVLLVDLDPQFNLSQYILGPKVYSNIIEENAETVNAIFRDEDRPSSLIDIIKEVVNWRDGSCLHLVPASLDLAWTVRRYVTARTQVLRNYLNDVREEYDIIIIDCAPTESFLSTAIYQATDYIFVPVKPEFLPTIGLALLLQSIEQHKRDHPDEPVPEMGGIVFNDTGEHAEHNRSRAQVRAIAKENGWYVFKNEVSHSNSYPAGARAGKPIFLTDNARSWKKEEFNRFGSEFLERAGF